MTYIREGRPKLIGKKTSNAIFLNRFGTRLTVHSSADETVSGSFDGIESDGALRLRRNDGSLEVIRAGDILLR